MNTDSFKDFCRDKNLRLSQPRFLVFQELSRAGAPVSPQELYQGLIKKRRKIGLTSIYRSLDLFESLGIAFKIVRGGNIKYKICDLRDHHHHIICKRCSRIVEFAFCDLSTWTDRLVESTGFQVTDHQVTFYGLCEACRKES